MCHRELRLASFLLLVALPPLGRATSADDLEFFEKKVRPLLVEHCYKCHSAGSEKIKGGLQLDTREGLLKGGESGPAIVAGDPETSLLVKAVRYTDKELQMPPKDKKLSEAQIADLVAWVKMGAPDPRVGKPPTADAPPATAAYDFAACRKQWAFRCPTNPPIPKVKSKHWIKSPIDNFILARLEENHLRPASRADRRNLLRRVTFDLTGLPPTPEEIDAFLQDSAPDAFAKVVDRLLSSPQYGERWGRHWLDVVRYTDSFDARGIGGEADVPEAYRYRDWVVQAFNQDLPYDRFLTEQIAGDLIPAREGGGFNTNGIIATGVMALGEWGLGDSDKKKMVTDIVDDQVDVIGRGILGLTLACARCHDHKFDPIPTEDYYSLAGIFFSSHILPKPGDPTAGSATLRIPLLPPEELERRKKRTERIAELEKQIAKEIDDQLSLLAKNLLPQTSGYLVAAWEYHNQSAQDNLAQFATARQLREPVLRRWVELSGNGNLTLLTQQVRDLLGNAGLLSWRNASNTDTPSVTANSTDKEIAFLTIKLPPHSVALHPSPKAGVMVGWKSPISGRINISGRVADADPNCGDGIDWTLTHRVGRGTSELTTGSITNGGKQLLTEGKGAEKLTAVEVQAGDMIQFAVLPKADHACDSTLLELEIAEIAGQTRTWNLSREVTPDFFEKGQGNPHTDGLGNKGVWHFYDMATPWENLNAPTNSALAQWFDMFEKAPRAVIEETAEKVQKEILTAAAEAGVTNANAKFADNFTAPRGLFWSALRHEPTAFSAETQATLTRWQAELADLNKNQPPPVPVAHGLQEGGVPDSPYAGIADAKIHIRGRYDRLGNVVPRRFPRILAGDNQPRITEGSGRLQLARWLTSPGNPLTARVMVNRIWQHHFGEGIVRTANNFGKLGEPPTHPELLDYLAQQFIQSGWSIKAMHRAMILSAAYQQSSIPNPATLKADPENKLFGRMNRRRLESEALRDSLLFVAGRLDFTSGGPASRNLGTNRRTLYVMTIRSDRATYQSLFDAANPAAITEKRIDSTVAPQALFLLNHPFMLDQTKALAQRMAKEGPPEEKRRIIWLYRELYGRPPTAEEIRIGLKAIGQARAATNTLTETEDTDWAWEKYGQVLICANEFIYVD